jgi:four helix bundle protein
LEQFINSRVMSKVERFEELECWKSARVLVVLIYEITATSKISKDWDMTRQIRRASLSVMNNIAEGFSRYHKRDFIHFLDISKSSASEIKSMIYVMNDLKYIDNKQSEILHQQTDKTRNLVLGLIRYLDNT